MYIFPVEVVCIFFSYRDFLFALCVCFYWDEGKGNVKINLVRLGKETPRYCKQEKGDRVGGGEVGNAWVIVNRKRLVWKLRGKERRDRQGSWRKGQGRKCCP